MAVVHLYLHARVEMAGQFRARLARHGHVPQHHAGHFQFLCNGAAVARFHVRIVVAGDPQPVAALHQGAQPMQVAVLKALVACSRPTGNAFPSGA